MKLFFNSSQQSNQKKERATSDITILSVTNEYEPAINGNSNRSDGNTFSLSSSSNNNNNNGATSNGFQASESVDTSEHPVNIQRPMSSQSNSSANGNGYFETGRRSRTNSINNANGNPSGHRSSRMSSGLGVFLRYAAPFIGADGVPGAPVRKPKKPRFQPDRIMSRLSSIRLSSSAKSSSAAGYGSSSSKSPPKQESLNGNDLVDGVIKIEEVDTGSPDPPTVFQEAMAAAASSSSRSQSYAKPRASWSITTFFSNLLGMSSSSANDSQQLQPPSKTNSLSGPAPSSAKSVRTKKSLVERPGSPDLSNLLSSGSTHSSPTRSSQRGGGGRGKRTSTISSQDEEDIEFYQFQHHQLHSILLIPEALKEMQKKGSKASMSTFSEGEGEVIESRLKDKISARIIVAIASAAEYLADKGTEFEVNGGEKSISSTPKASSLSARLFGRSPKVNERATATNNKNNYPQTPPNPVLSSNFAGAKKPKIPLDRYLTRIVRYLNTFHEQHPSADSVGTRCLVIATHLIDRLRMKFSDPLVGPCTFQLNQMNVHRLFLVACLLAVKITEDDHPTNDYMANVGGIELKELDTLESHFCNAIGFDFHLNPLEIQELYNLFDPEQSHTLKEPTGDGPP